MSSRTDSDDQEIPLANRVKRLEHRIDHLLKPEQDEQAEQLDEIRRENEALRDRVAELEAATDTLRDRLEATVGVADASESTPQRRARDLREALVRVARNTDAAGVTWWWQEVRDHLAQQGHEGFSKPTYYTAMDDAADKDGFVLADKRVPSHDQPVKAIRVKFDELPPAIRQSGVTGGSTTNTRSNQLTTQGEGGDTGTRKDTHVTGSEENTRG